MPMSEIECGRAEQTRCSGLPIGGPMVSTAVQCPPVVILLVEDDPGDQLITKEAFKSLKVPYDLRMVCDGKEALDYLYRLGRYASAPAPLPDLILLDLNMPQVNGRQVAKQIRADPQLRRIPVVVLTTSRREEDVLQAYGQGVMCFLSKPVDFKRFVATIRGLERLIKFALALKSLGERTRITDRQIFRLVRRRQLLEYLSDKLFEHHMKQIESVLLAGGGEELPGREDPALKQWQSETSARQALLQLANQLLQNQPGEPPPQPAEASASFPAAQQERGSTDPCDTARNLSELARSLDLLAKKRGRSGS